MLVGTYGEDETSKKKELTAKGERIFESIVPKFSRSFSNLSLYVVGVFGKNLDNIDSLRAGLHVRLETPKSNVFRLILNLGRSYRA